MLGWIDACFSRNEAAGPSAPRQCALLPAVDKGDLPPRIQRANLVQPPVMTTRVSDMGGAGCGERAGYGPPSHLPTSLGPTTSSTGLSGGRLDRICSRPSTWSACLCDSQMQQRPETCNQVPRHRGTRTESAATMLWQMGDCKQRAARDIRLTTAVAPSSPELLTRPPQVPSPQSTIM